MVLNTPHGTHDIPHMYHNIPPRYSTFNSVTDINEKLNGLLLLSCKTTYPQTNIYISSITPRKDDFNGVVTKVNQLLAKEFEDSKYHGIKLIDHSNLDSPELLYDTKHVNKNSGIKKLGFPTRVTSHACTLIDHIFYFSRTSGVQVSSDYLMTNMSDHFANFMILHSRAKSIAAERSKVRIFSDENRNNFRRLIGEIKWEKELIDKNTNEAMLIFNQTLCSAYNKSFPFKRLSRKRAKNKPWITSSLKQSIKQKLILYQKYIFHQTEENKTIYKLYKKQINIYDKKSRS